MSQSSAAIVAQSPLSKTRDRLFARVTPLLLRIFLSIGAIAVPQIAHAVPSVWLQSPHPGQNPNQLLVDATAYASDGMTGWAIYVDDHVAYQVNTGSNVLTHTLNIANGRHLLYARAWDRRGSGTSATLLIQIGPPAWSSSALPTPPASAQVLRQMQNTTADWKDCSICAAGTNDTTNYWMAPFRSEPSMSGSSRELFAGGLPWTNVLFIKTMSETTNVTHYLWDFWIYHDPTSAANIWSAEFDLFHVLGGHEFMMGSQCDFGDGYWNTWDSANNRWIMIGLPCSRWAPDTWHHVQWYVERINPTQYRYDTLVVDGHGYGINEVWSVNPTSWPDAVGIQYQLDQSASGTPVHQWIDNVKLTVW